MSDETGQKHVLFRIKELKKYFPITRGVLMQRHIADVRAVDGISFDIYQGETLGLVGESGCGKSTAGRTILQLYAPTDGSVVYKGQDLAALKSKELRKIRPELQIIFQDPYASLNPRMPVGNIISEAAVYHGILSKDQREARVKELLELVGLNPAFINRYPHEFSGGQRQRIGIARALATEPTFIVADEPISALDVSIQAQVVNLLDELKSELDLTYLFIAHDLSMVRYISDRVAVMYLGRIVELGEVDEVYERPLHPYTQALLSAIPVPDPDVEDERDRIVLEGDVPSPADPPPGCRFHTRCRFATEICGQEDPVFRDLAAEGKQAHWVACHHAETFLA